MGQKPEVERLAEAVRKAEAELDATSNLTDLKAAARRLQRARAALAAAQEAAKEQAPGA
jgi:hypothetical protein